MKLYQRIVKSVITLTIFVLMFKFDVKAEDTSHLLKMYNVEVNGTSMKEIEDEFNRLESQLKEAQEIKAKIDWVNSSINAARLQYEKKEREILDKANEMIADNMKVKSSIESNIYGDIETLIASDAIYKSNVKKVDIVLSELDTYANIEFLNTETVDIDEILEEYQKVQSEFEDAVVHYELGDVTNLRYIMDVPYHVNSEYGTRVDPINPSTTRFHSGVDLRCKTGTKVGALFNGVVSGCGWSDTSGYWIRLEHGDSVRSFYCHLSEILCKEGQEISQYETIALSGGTGSRSTGPHLHLAMYINGNSVNPQILYEK